MAPTGASERDNPLAPVPPRSPSHGECHPGPAAATMPSLVRVLLVDDDGDDRLLVADLLADAERCCFTLSWASNYADGLAAIARQEHDVYLLDYRLGGDDGLQLLQEARQQGFHAPMILLTGQGDGDIDVEAIRSGAADYLAKGSLDAALLERSLLYALERQRAEARQAQLLDELRQANQELKDFAHIVSHDLKAPLRGARYLVDLLHQAGDERLEPGDRQLLDLLDDRMRGMSRLIERVLQYSLVERQAETAISCDLEAIVAEVVRALAPPSHIAIAIESLPTIATDPTRMQQIFQNLLANAIAYNDKPQGQVAIRCEERGNAWLLSVADNGPGIPAQHARDIFKIFFALAPSDALQSTGVGLAIVKKIVELYGGEIWVESELGVGSTFWFTLAKAPSPIEHAGEPSHG